MKLNKKLEEQIKLFEDIDTCVPRDKNDLQKEICESFMEIMTDDLNDGRTLAMMVESCVALWNMEFGEEETYQQEEYRPMPDWMTIKESPIQGVGVFVKDLHVVSSQWEAERLTHKRTPEGTIDRLNYGGYINHSSNPNARIAFDDKGHGRLVLLRSLYGGEEVTVDYSKNECGRGYIDKIKNLK